MGGSKKPKNNIGIQEWKKIQGKMTKDLNVVWIKDAIISKRYTQVKRIQNATIQQN